MTDSPTRCPGSVSFTVFDLYKRKREKTGVEDGGETLGV